MKTPQFETNKIPMVSITPHGITTYYEFIDKKRHRAEYDDITSTDTSEFKEIENKEDSKKKHSERFDHKGLMSYHAQKKMKTALEWLLLISRKKRVYSRRLERFINFKICFVTLTLPSQQRHTDQQIKSKCLNSLLIELRKFHGLKNYIWRAEKQANGNIHFHLIFDKFIEADKLRERWNRIVDTLGYTSEYTERMRNEVKEFSDYYNMFYDQGNIETLRKRFIYGKSTNWTNPNSTDIHSVKKVRNIIAYLFKYMSKNVDLTDNTMSSDIEDLKVSGQLWNLSETLSKMNSVKCVISRYESAEINKLWENVKSYTYVDDYFSFKAISIKDLFSLECENLIQHVYEKLIDVFGIHDIGFLH